MKGWELVSVLYDCSHDRDATIISLCAACHVYEMLADLGHFHFSWAISETSNHWLTGTIKWKSALWLATLASSLLTILLETAHIAVNLRFGKLCSMQNSFALKLFVWLLGLVLVRASKLQITDFALNCNTLKLTISYQL